MARGTSGGGEAMNPTNEHREQAREIRFPFPCGCVDAHQGGGIVVEEYTCEAHRAIADALSSRDAEVREVLEGLASKVYVSFKGQYCWCRTAGLATRPEGDRHDLHCERTRDLYSKLQAPNSEIQQPETPDLP